MTIDVGNWSQDKDAIHIYDRALSTECHLWRWNKVGELAIRLVMETLQVDAVVSIFLIRAFTGQYPF